MAGVEELQREANRIVQAVENTEQKMIDRINERDTALENRFQGYDQAVGQISVLEKNYEDLRADLESKNAEIMELKAEGNRPGSAVRDERKSVGRQLIESDVYENYKGQNWQGRTNGAKVEIPMERRALTSSDAAGYGNMGWRIEPQELGEIQRPNLEEDIVDLFPVIRATSDVVHYIEMLGYANIYTELDAAALSTATSVTVKATSGMFVGQELIFGNADASDDANVVTRRITSITEATRVVTLDGALGVAKNANDPVTSNAIGMTPHGAQKPEASLRGYREVSYPIGTMAHYMVAHRQTLADAPQLQGIVNNSLLDGLRRSVGIQVLYGNGASPNLQGLANNPNIQNQAAFTGTRDAGGIWRYAHIRRAIAMSQISGFPPSALLIHPLNMVDLELAQDTTNNFINTVVTDGASQRLWRLPVRVTTAIRQDEFMLGGFGQAAYLLNREDANVRFSDQHKDFFTANMVAILAEQRLGMATPYPQALTKGSLA